MKKKISLLLAALSLVAFAAVGCAKKSTGSTEQAASNSPTVKEIKITHVAGETTLNANPKKVVVFDFGILDALDKMGVEIAALPKKSVPAYLEKYKGDKYTDVGTLQEPNFEKIFEVKPELIIISTRQATLYEEFKKIAPTVQIEIKNDDYIGSFKNNMVTLGKIFSKEAFVEKEIKTIDDSIKALSEKVTASGKNALVILANDGALSAYGQVSRFGIIHKNFGFTPVDKNIEVSTHGQNISFEYIAQKNPDYLFVIDRAAVAGGSNTAQKTLENDLIKSTTAYKNNKIIYLDAPVWYVSVGGFTSTAKMISEVEAAVK